MEVAAFRTAVREWLDEHDLTPPAAAHESLDGELAQLSRVRAALYEAGLMRYGWPEEVGGLGGSALLRAVLGEEVAARDLAEPGNYSMVEVLVPTMIAHAPPGLAAQMVPLLLSGKEQWCQGFSEPGSGSDLASLSTRAVQRGDEWVITGQKVWTSLAQYAARCVLLTRTGPAQPDKHSGITAFFVDMSSPGITVRPLRTMHGVDEFAEVFLDSVVVPAARMLGQPGDGWRIASDLLPYERSTCFWHRSAYLLHRLNRLVTSAALTPADEAAIGSAYLALHTTRCRSRETQYRLAATGTLGPETSVDKILLQSAEQQLYDTARDLLPGSVELDESAWRTEYLYSRAATIYGGTAEIQRNIVARRLLGLGKD
ncbi:MAG TPA: acyl-CoA dehydrogenase family protein [Trebonia sp.]|nr:acyl-CoA dehydrogenase family protein [Trebonia sp.]